MADFKPRVVSHPNNTAAQAYEDLVGIDEIKADLLAHLTMTLDPGRLAAWLSKHHPGGLPSAVALSRRPRTVLLSGDVGCGKTALAQSIATPLVSALDRPLVVVEAPTDLRGSGLVGEISQRITRLFEHASDAANKQPGLLILDEVDDIATTRDQHQAHHEDRAGLNALLKQLDRLGVDQTPMVAICITNRPWVLDPALHRRVGLHLRFPRPGPTARAALFTKILAGTSASKAEIDRLVKATERPEHPYTSSDLVRRVGDAALLRAWQRDQPLSVSLIQDVLAEVEPSPQFQEPGGAK